MQARRAYVGAHAAIVEEGRVLVAVGDVEIGVFAVDGALVAYENCCPHQGGPVCRGKVLARVTDDDAGLRSVHVEGSADLSCPWHGWEYDLRTGRHIGSDRVGLRPFPVVVEEGRVFVEVAQ
jgi:nitrite reductase/ring-hydroxylating ferredoxin subunit